jgi:4a-hydroxytetrahydrobiopterin dehydratase
MINIATLLAKKSLHTAAGLDQPAINAYLTLLPDWKQDHKTISRTYAFRNYHETLAFVNAVAYVVHAEDHHPELVVTYNRCVVHFDTHTVDGGKGGISENDFICAAKVDAIFNHGHAGI